MTSQKFLWLDQFENKNLRFCNQQLSYSSTFDALKQHDFVTRWKATHLLMLWIRVCNFCNEPFSCSCCNQYLMFWSNKMKSYSAAIAVNKNLQFMQYTLSTLLSSFPWTTQKSIIVENSKIVENFGATIFSTIMEFDCIWYLRFLSTAWAWAEHL